VSGVVEAELRIDKVFDGVAEEFERAALLCGWTAAKDLAG
jgi:hypothetical protein